jgi:hypothetical protein
MQNQREAVFTLVTNTVQVNEGEAVVLTKSDRDFIIESLVTGFSEGNISMSDAARAKHDTEQKLRAYSSGLLNNWLRKDKRLNGNVKYQTKNPGSRAGSGDDQVRELRKLKSTLTDSDQIAKVEQAIQDRINELKAEKNQATVKDIDFSLIPEFARLAG